ncbi:MAG: lytic transglycosylase domain-containing protein [Parasphingorhabdus sp.]|nr:lytic transglycosylase domain-containing protein [Parasphingorhabdus sp.]
MSSMLYYIPLLLALALPAAALAADQTGVAQSGTSLSDPTGGNAQLGLQRWRVLSQSDNYSFDDYAGFLVSYPGWPDDMRMRRTAEQAINANSFSPTRVIAFFDRLPPLTPTGMAKYAIALAATGQQAKAQEWARAAWRAGTLTVEDEMVVLGQFAAAITPEDHDARMNALLWARATVPATRQLAFTSGSTRAVFAARLAQITNAADANAQASAVESIARDDPGYLADRARYLRNSGNPWAVRQLLANRPALRVQPTSPETWYEALLLVARDAANDNQHQTAFAIASRLDDAFPAGTDISDLSLGVRDDYTSLAWLAGTSALYGTNRPADAIGMFDRYGRGAKTPQTRSKGFYWAGRAAEQAGQRDVATRYFEQAAQYPSHFYGQLAHERLNRTLPKFNRAPEVELTDADRRAFDSEPLVIAAKLSARTGDWKEHTKFFRALAFNAKTEKDYALLADMSRRTGQRDLGVISGQSALNEKVGAIDAVNFPLLDVPSGYENGWTFIHAISRQESQFAQGAVSHAGARGLMQLMPGTAREQSGKVGLSYDLSALTGNPGYNIQLGSGYFQRMLDYYGGSYPLAVAAYNAGPGNVNKWLRANGDPRMGGIDWIKWIEEIPIFETKNYVHRVLENAVVYDTLNPRGPTYKSDTPLTRFIGKNYKG